MKIHSKYTDGRRNTLLYEHSYDVKTNVHDFNLNVAYLGDENKTKLHLNTYMRPSMEDYTTSSDVVC